MLDVNARCKRKEGLERLLTPSEVAELFGVPVKRLREWRRSGVHRGPAYIRIEQAARYQLADLQEYIRKHRLRPGAKGKRK